MCPCNLSYTVISAKAGIQLRYPSYTVIPAKAGIQSRYPSYVVIPAKAGIQCLTASLYCRSWIRGGLVLACVIPRPGRLRSGRFTRLPASESLSLCWPKEKVTKERMAFRARALSSIERYNRSNRLSNRQGTLQALVRYAELVREAS